MASDSVFSSYVITDPCIGVKDGTCVEVCPVDCIETTDDSDQYFVDPSLCIACEQCVLVCPVDAIYLEHEVPEEWKASIEKNRNFFLDVKGNVPAVPLEWAGQLIKTARGLAEELGIDVSIVVVDQQGEAVVTSSASAGDPDKGQTAANRAYTAAAFVLSTSQVTARHLERASESLNRARIVTGPGGLPIGRPYVVGAIGVAGGTPEQDEQCCRAAVNAS